MSVTPIVVKRLNERAPLPHSNPFTVIPVSTHSARSDNYVVSTGIEFSIPSSLRLDIFSQIEDIFIVGWSMCPELKVLVFISSTRVANKLVDGGIFARGVLSGNNVAPVRFLESTDEGTHVVRGDDGG